MNTPEIKQFIRENNNLFWYIADAKREEISYDILVETILNYGDLDSVIRLINILGIQKVSKIFFESINRSNRRRGNYHELTINYFTLVFKKYTHGSSQQKST